MKLYRAHGLGNDYLILEEGPEVSPDLARRLCHRHTGVGGDGVLEPRSTGRADHGVRIWNPDGSVAEKSGNGLRIFAWWLHHERRAPAAFTVDTGHDVVGCEVDDTIVEVEMGTATVAPEVSLRAAGAMLPCIGVDVGNPHCVIFSDEPELDALPWRAWGEALEVHPHFPNRTNVQIARIERGPGPAAVDLRIWERGAGETLASGSSSCAVAAAAVHTGRLPAGPIEVRMPGGVLRVTVRADGTVLLRGPVAPVARVEVHPAWAVS